MQRTERAYGVMDAVLQAHFGMESDGKTNVVRILSVQLIRAAIEAAETELSEKLRAAVGNIRTRG